MASIKLNKEIIEGSIKGDRKCQKKIFKSFYGKVLSICNRYAGDKDEAQDFAQDVFIKVFEKMHQYSFASPFEHWISVVAKNTAVDCLRQKDKFDYFEEDPTYVYSGLIEEGVNVEDEGWESFLEVKSLKPEIIIQEIQNLSPAYRAVFSMYVLEEKSHKEIAQALGITESTSKTNLMKAKIVLRNKLKALSKKNVEQVR